jgi:hypothetical protein
MIVSLLGKIAVGSTDPERSGCASGADLLNNCGPCVCLTPARKDRA